MTADEIGNAQFECDDGAWESARWLKQIALQLAELNLTAKIIAHDIDRLAETQEEAHK